MKPRSELERDAIRSPAVGMGDVLLLEVLLDLRDQVEENNAMWHKLFRCVRDPPAWAVRLESKVDQLIAAQAVIQQKEDALMATQAEIDQALQEMRDALTAETDAEKAIVTQLDGLAGLIDKLIAGAGASGTVNVADLQTFRDALAAQKDEMAAAMLRDTRADPNAPPA